MAKNKNQVKLTPLQHEERYVEFLTTRLASENWRAQATSEEVELTKQKLDKAKFKLKMLRMVK